MKWFWIFASLLVLTLGPAAAPAAATETTCLPTGPDLEQAGWVHLTFPHLKAIDFDRAADGAVIVRANQATSVLAKEGAGNLPWLTWSWRVAMPAPPTDLSARGKDDRSLIVHVWVPFEDGTALTLWPHIDDRGRLLTYLWGGIQKKGALIRNPYIAENGALIVLQNSESPTGDWMDEAVDWRQDYRRAFGENPPPTTPVIGLSADTDDTGSRSLGRIKDVCFSGEAPAG